MTAGHGAPERPGKATVLRLADGRRLSLRRWPGVGTPVVLLHGLLDSSAGWDSLATALPNPCIAFDLPGFGDSDLPARPRLAAYAAHVAAALDELEIESFVLVGHSLGGGVATRLSAHAPGRVAGLVLLAPAGFGRIPLAEAVSVPGLRNLVSRSLPLALSNPVVLTLAYMTMVSNRRLPDTELLNRVMRRSFDAVPGARDGTRAVVAAGLNASRLPHEPLPYRGPVAVVWGSHDRLVPIAHADVVARCLPQAEVEVWEGMGHHPQRERPIDLARLIRRAAEAAAPARAADGGTSAPSVAA